jgi:ABC-2 type transport system ATP-binding protein
MESVAPIDAPASIVVEGLVVRFGDLEAVAGVSFEVKQGEVFGLLGPNGAGKTTTLRVLTTLLRPTAGSAYVLGHDVQRQSVLVRTAIGYVPQAISVDPALTGRENLEFYARVTGVPRHERQERIDHVAEVMGVEAFSGRLARSLSGGMLRRLEIASALLNRPAVLFLDEPTMGLDPTARRLVWERLAALREEAGTSLLVTTHLMEEAESRCDRVAIMDRGRIAAQGTPADLRDETGTTSLEDVFAAVTGHELDEEEGSFRGIRAGRRLVRRLG